MSKRVVLHHTEGRYAGLWQIVGTTDQLPKAAKVDLPEFLPKLRFLDHLNAASLVWVKPRYVLYREVKGPGKRGKLNEFHPSQV